MAATVILTARADAAGGELLEASYYGEELAGSPQANGEPFQPYGFTAAHKFLPLGTPMTVCHDGACVDVVIEDRGPYIGGRDLDLSKGAALEIGLADEGVGIVEVFYW